MLYARIVGTKVISKKPVVVIHIEIMLPAVVLPFFLYQDTRVYACHMMNWPLSLRRYNEAPRQYDSYKARGRQRQ
jgi:hypothetical protein